MPPLLEVAVSQMQPPHMWFDVPVQPSQTAVTRTCHSVPVHAHTEPAMSATQTSPPSPAPIATKRPV